MQLGKALIGGLIGAAVGIGLLIIVYLTLQHDKVWLSIPFALITGLGVRMMIHAPARASYIRGAMTMLLALTAYIGGWIIVAQIATARANAPTQAPAAPAPAPAARVDSADAEAKDGDATEESKDDPNAAESTPETKPDKPKVVTRSGSGSTAGSLAPRSMNYGAGDVICLAIAALVAYELGRGSGTGVIAASQPTQPMPVGTHPDA